MKNQVIEIEDFKMEKVVIEIVGMSPLIMHNFPEKARKEIRDKQQGEKNKREIRKPELETKQCLHLTDDGVYGFPAMGFKKGMLNYAYQHKFFKNKTAPRASFMVVADCPVTNLVKITGDWEMVEDWVRLNGSSADLRYRPYFKEWSALVRIEYSPNLINEKAIAALLQGAGRFYGIGDNRPEKDGPYGQYKIKGT